MAISKYVEIAEELRKELRRHRPGDRFLSEHQVALRFDVSRPTASRALGELCRDGLVERRVGSGTYVVDPSPGTGPDRLRSVGLLLSGLGATEMWDPLSTQVTRVAASMGISLRLGPPAPPKDDVDFTRAQAADLIDQGVDGVLFAPLEGVEHRERENREICRRFTAAGTPVVLIDRDGVDFPARSQFDIVGVDNVRGAAQLGGHLVAQGFCRPMFFTRPQHPSSNDQRMAGALVAFLSAGIAVDPAWHVSGDPSDLAALGAALETRRPDVVLASNDHTAALLVQTITRLGRTVPGDLAVVGFDDSPYSALLTVPLTTVRQPFEAIARAAVRTLLARAADPDAPAREILLPPELVVRGSTARAGGH